MKCEKCGTEYEGNFCPNGCNVPAAPQPKAKKPIYKKWWFWVVIAVVGIVLIASVGGSETPTQTEPSQSESAASETTAGQTDANDTAAEQSADEETQTQPTDNVYHAGDTIDANGMMITYHKASEYVSDNRYLQAEDGFMYIALQITAENKSSTDKYISSFEFECYADGTKVESYYGGENNFEGGTLSAGRKAEGYIYFTVPEDAKEIEVEYETNYWSDKKAILKVEL